MAVVGFSLVASAIIGDSWRKNTQLELYSGMREHSSEYIWKPRTGELFFSQGYVTAVVRKEEMLD